MIDMRQALLIGLILAWVPQLARADLDERVPAKPGGLLQVDLDLGDDIRPERVSLVVRSHDADEVWVVADLSGLGSSTVKFRVDHDDRVVRIYGRSGGLMSWILGGPGVAVRVWVPREFSVDLRCSTGPIRIEDISGQIRARTVDGAIGVEGVQGNVALRTERGAVTLNEVVGDVSLKAVSDGSLALRWVTGRVDARTETGNISARHISGPMTLRTDGGEIQVEEVHGRVEARTEGGAIYTSFASAPSGVLETRRGSVEVVLPDHAGAMLDARTANGRVEVVNGLAVRGDRGPDFVVGQVNGGGDPLKVFTARGTIRLVRR